MEIELFQNTYSSENFITGKDLKYKNTLSSFSRACNVTPQESTNAIRCEEDISSIARHSFVNHTCSDEPYCQIKLDSILKLKDSTKQLLCLLEEIQTKVHTNNLNSNDHTRFSSVIKTNIENETHVGTSKHVSEALEKLKNQTRELDYISVKNEDDDCSIYKRLTRKCHCLNHPDYNDFVIHFNEESKYNTSNLGELIKNMRILRKFLYMGGENTKNALMFLSEGLMDSPYAEKVDIALGCAHADICNIFEDHSIVTVCISWPCKYRHYGNYLTQNLAAGFLYKLAELEEGRKYLNYTSKISNDIRKILRKKSSYLEIDIVESLNATLNILKPSFTKDFTVTYFRKSIYEGIGTRTVRDLMQHQQHMTLDEIFTHLHLLNNYSSFECGKEELTQQFPFLLIVFKYLLIEYDESELNVLVISILNNIMTKNTMRLQKSTTSKYLVLADTVTEPIKMKNEACQIPPKKAKKVPKPRSGLGVSPNNYQLPRKKEWKSSILITNRSRRFNDLAKSMIIVPIENK